MDLLSSLKTTYSKTVDTGISVLEFLELAKKDASVYSSPHERLLKAIGEPELIDTSKDQRLARLFSNRIVRRYAAFKDFYGMEEVIERIVDYLKHASQGLEEAKQILYLLGPVGSAKSSLAERIKLLMEIEPVYVIEGSPVHDSPLSLFTEGKHGEHLKKEYGIPLHKLRYKPSPWLIKRLEESGGDISKIKVIKLQPNINRQICIAKTEPGDENNQDISSLVGKIDIRKLEKYSQDDPDAYSYSGGLCLGNRGVLEFVEMFKAPLKVLHPLLTATQEGNYNGTEAISAIPFEGIVLAHSNESEWASFKHDKTNEAFIDRVYIVKVPYCLRITEESRIYKKLLERSELSKAPVAPQTLDILAKFSVLSRLVEPKNSLLESKLKVYDGESLKDKDSSAKPYHEYRSESGLDEGMHGMSTRFAFKVLSKTFNYDGKEIAANPIHLFHVLESAVKSEQLGADHEAKLLGFIKSPLQKEYTEYLQKEVQTAFFESYAEYGQNIFDKYILHVDSWLQEQDYRNPDTGEIYNRLDLNEELEKLEKPAGISNVKEFRNDLMHFVLRARTKNDGQNPRWDAYEKMKDVIEKRMFANAEDILPVLSFGQAQSADTAKKHKSFVERMIKLGYTESQVKLIVDFYLRTRKN